MHDLQRILHQSLIPQTKSSAFALVMTPNVLRGPHQTGVNTPGRIPVHAHPSSLLPSPRQRVPWPHAGIWEKQSLEASLLPRIGYILDGELECHLGVTHNMVKADPQLDARHGLYTVTLPERTWLVVPAGVPMKSGRHPFLALIPPHLARSRIYWVSFLPMGVVCYYHHREGLADVANSEIFIPDYQCSMLADFFLEALQEDTSQSKALMQAHLLALLLRIDWLWTKSSTVNADVGFLSNLPTLSASDAKTLSLHLAHHPTFQPSPVEATRSYVDSHLGQPLSLKSLAANSCVSTASLNRLFRVELGISVQQYITRSRIEAACAMLEHTNLPVEWISSHFTFTNHPYFYRLFTKQKGLSPSAYRKNKRLALPSTATKTDK